MVVSILPCAEFRRNDHLEDAPHFILKSLGYDLLECSIWSHLKNSVQINDHHIPRTPKLQCHQWHVIKKLEKAPRRFFNPKRVWKIGESERKEILQWISTISTAVKIHSIKEAGKNLILNHKIAYLSFRWTFNFGQGSMIRQWRHLYDSWWRHRDVIPILNPEFGIYVHCWVYNLYFGSKTRRSFSMAWKIFPRTLWSTQTRINRRFRCSRIPCFFQTLWKRSSHRNRSFILFVDERYSGLARNPARL